ncbi:hypothetical protein [Cellulomonas sp. P5_E12]
MTTTESPSPEVIVDPSTPVTKSEAKRLAREAKAVQKANRNWFRRHKFTTALGASAALIAGIVIGTGGGSDNAKPEAAAAVIAADVAEDVAAPEAPAPAEEAPVAITGGDHIVGTDIAAGQYRATVDDSFFKLGSVTQKNGDDILDIRTANEGSVIFTVQDVPGSVVSFDGFSTIVSTAEVPGVAPAQLGNGDWLVGNEITAGQYSAVVDTDAIIVLGSVTQTNGTEILDITTGDTGNVVFTVKDVPGSVVSFSGVKDITKVG